jgi:hypothetical protein
MGLVQIPGEEEEEYVYDGPVLQMSSAVLPADYPLFDWADWPESYAALVPGGPTRKFERACWNAIIETLAQASEEAGFTFYNEEKGFGREDLLMTTGYFGRLTAERMTATVAAVNNLVPLKWIWNNDRSRTFLDYMRTGFWGINNPYGFTPDVVYPEYILDLARRVNMLIEFMRDTFPYFAEPEVKKVLTGISAQPGLRSGFGGPVNVKQKNRTITADAPVVDGLALHVDAERPSRITISCTPEAMAYGYLNIPVYWIGNPVKAEGHVRRVTGMQCESMLLKSNVYLRLEAPGPLEFGADPVRSLGRQLVSMTNLILTPFSWEHEAATLSAAELQQKPPKYMSGAAICSVAVAKTPVYSAPTVPVVLKDKRKTFSKTDDTVSLPGLEAKAQQKGKSGTYTDREKILALRLYPIEQNFFRRFFSSSSAKGVVAPEAFYVEQEHISRMSASCGGVLPARGRPFWPVKISRLTANPEISHMPGREVRAAGSAVSKAKSSLEYLYWVPVDVGQESGIRGMCELTTLWDAPRWVDGGLLIRQTRKAKILADGSMDLSCGYDPMYAQAYSRTMASAGLDTKWLPPVWTDGGLYIRQLREVIVLPEGGLDLSSGGEELLQKHISVTAAACKLGTLWEPPVMVDGGLYLRQTQSAVQNDKYELEVQ